MCTEPIVARPKTTNTNRPYARFANVCSDTLSGRGREKTCTLTESGRRMTSDELFPVTKL